MSERAVRANGFTLVEILIALVLLTVLFSLGVPPLWSWTERQRLRMAAGELRTVLHVTRMEAVRSSLSVGVRFYPSEREVTFGVFADGDYDGVLNEDIDAGVDRPIRPPRTLAQMGGDIRFGFPTAGLRPSDPTTGKPLDELDDPIRFNRSDIASFSPIGAATPGTVYLTDGRRGMAAVRVSNRAGRVRIYLRDAADGSWRQY